MHMHISNTIPTDLDVPFTYVCMYVELVCGRNSYAIFINLIWQSAVKKTIRWTEIIHFFPLPHFFDINFFSLPNEKDRKKCHENERVEFQTYSCPIN